MTNETILDAAKKIAGVKFALRQEIQKEAFGLNIVLDKPVYHSPSVSVRSIKMNLGKTELYNRRTKKSRIVPLDSLNTEQLVNISQQVLAREYREEDKNGY